jgi:pyruvate,orthophosphate dikinase
LIPEDVNLYVHTPDEATIKQSEVLNSFLTEHDLSLDSMLEMSWQRLQNLFAPKEQDLYLQRLKLLCYCHYLLMDKYNLDPYDIVKFLSRYTWFDAKEQNRLRSSLVRNDYDSSHPPDAGQYWQTFRSGIGSQNPANIGKTSISKGISPPAFLPCMVCTRAQTRSYWLDLPAGKRRSPPLYPQCGTIEPELHKWQDSAPYHQILELYDYAMEQELITNDAFSTALSMLRSAQHLANLSLDQYLDMFKLLKDSVSELINEYYYRFYDNALKQLTEHSQATGITEMFAEEFYRKLLSASFLVQGLDSFITRIIEALAEMKQLFSVSDIPRVMSYDPDQLFYHLDTKNSRIENQVLLGSKGYFLKRMRQYEFPVPDGFVITTELYRQRDIINMHPDISSEFDTLLYKHLQRLEHKTGLRLGDPSRPLLISCALVRLWFARSDGHIPEYRAQ